MEDIQGRISMVANKKEKECIDWGHWGLSKSYINSDIEDYEGFIYQVNEKSTGMLYIGQKKFWKRVKYKPLKGMKRPRWKKLSSDWRTYKTSNKILQEKIAKNRRGYEMWILKLCKSKIEMNIYETKEQIDWYTSGNWNRLYNECINCRMRIRKSDASAANNSSLRIRKSNNKSELV